MTRLRKDPPAESRVLLLGDGTWGGVGARPDEGPLHSGGPRGGTRDISVPQTEHRSTLLRSEPRDTPKEPSLDAFLL